MGRLTVIHEGRICKLQISWEKFDGEDGEDGRLEAEVLPVPVSTPRSSEVSLQKTLDHLGITLGRGTLGDALRGQMLSVWNERGAEDSRLINSFIDSPPDGEPMDVPTLQRVVDLLQRLNR